MRHTLFPCLHTCFAWNSSSMEWNLGVRDLTAGLNENLVPPGYWGNDVRNQRMPLFGNARESEERIEGESREYFKNDFFRNIWKPAGLGFCFCFLLRLFFFLFILFRNWWFTGIGFFSLMFLMSTDEEWGQGLAMAMHKSYNFNKYYAWLSMLLQCRTFNYDTLIK